jgi:hypothetical protein
MILIYSLVDPRSDHVRYIGQTNNPTNRLACHCRQWRKRTKRGLWIAELRDVGLRPRLEGLEVAETELQASILEGFWISSLRAAGANLVNIADVNDDPTTWRKAVSQANRGRSLTPEHRVKIGAHRLGEKRSPETIAKMVIAASGRKWTAEQREKIVAGLRAWKRPPSYGQAISAAKKGKTSPAIKRAAKAAQEARAKLPVRLHTKEDREAISRGLLGKKHSTERIERRRLAQIGRSTPAIRASAAKARAVKAAKHAAKQAAKRFLPDPMDVKTVVGP